MPPSVLERSDAVYPADAMAAGREGTVDLLVTLDANGIASHVEVTQPAEEPFVLAAKEALSHWKFAPATSDGQPIASRIHIPFRFALPKAPPPAPLASAPDAGGFDASTPPPPGMAPPSGPAGNPDAGNPDAGPVDAVPVDVRAGDGGEPAVLEATVLGRRKPPSRGASDYQLEVGGLATVPHQNAADVLKLAPGILLTNEGGQGHAEQVFLRGFDAREGQDIEFTVDGVPINESGNPHGNGYSDTHFIIPELIDSLRVVEGPFDPRQGNYAVAGSADYHLALGQRGMTSTTSAGNFGTARELLTYGPPDGRPGTFLAVQLYQTNGFGADRDGRSGTFMGQYEGQVNASTRYRLTATAYSASFHSAGVIREDDYKAGRVGFYGDYLQSGDVHQAQGEDSSRYSLAGAIETRSGKFSAESLAFLIYRPLRLRENFTGFLLDVQEPLQQPHSQRGDLIDLHASELTIGVKGNARVAGEVLQQLQEIEVGYFARADVVSAMQQRIEDATGAPYHTDLDLDSTLGDIGLYVDANLRFTRWLSLRGGLREDLFTFDVNNLCAVQSISNPSPSNPPGDQSCLSQESSSAASVAYREPNQRATTSSTALLPRGSLLLGPFWGLSASASAGQGVRSIDPSYITQGKETPFASASSFDGGLSFQRRLFDNVGLVLRSVVFDTRVDKDLIFSETAGRNILGGPSTRLGSANSARLTGSFFDVAANLTYVKATFDDTHLLIPYVPDLVFRTDAAVHEVLPWWREQLLGHPLRASFGTGITYVGPRPLPYGSRSDSIFTVDTNLVVGWWFVNLGLSVENLLDARYMLGEYNYAADFHTQPLPTLVPTRLFTAGAPRTVLFSLSVNYGGDR